MAKSSESAPTIVNPRKLADPFLNVAGAALAVGREPEQVAALAEAGTIRSMERDGLTLVSFDDLNRLHRAEARERLAEKLRQGRQAEQAEPIEPTAD